MSEARCLIRGSINIDEFFHVKDIVRPGETISSDGLEKRAGGKGANQAVAVARAGAKADLVGAVGDDGLWVLEQLKASNVHVDSVSVVKEPTGRAIIQLTDVGENSIILFKGANYATLPGIPKLHPETTHILLQNEIPFAETIAYLSLAHSFASESEKPISTVFNPSPMPSDAQLKSFPWDKLTWLIVNEGEASDLSRVLANEDGVVHPVEGNTEGELGAAKRLLQKLSQQIPHTHVVCTLGAKGVLALLRPGNAVSDEGSALAPDAPDGRGRIQDPIYLPAATLECVTDTTGAGDCFAGYLVAGLMSLGTGHEELSKDDVVNVLRRCVQAAGLCVEKRGAMESIPRREDVDSRLSA